MKDFDIGRHEQVNADRKFKIGGQEFTFKARVGADLLADYFDAAGSEDAGVNRRVLTAADRLILSWLDPGQEHNWQQVRSPDAADPLTIRDVQEVVAHMLEAIAGRPTGSPSGSSASSSQPGTSSTDGSPSPVQG